MYVAFFKRKDSGFIDFYDVDRLRLEYKRVGTEHKKFYVLTPQRVAEQFESPEKFIYCEDYELAYVSEK